MADKIRYGFRPFWKQHFPLYAGLAFEFLSFGFYRYAGGGWGVRLVLLGCEFTAQRLGMIEGNMQGQAQTQQPRW